MGYIPRHLLTQCSAVREIRVRVAPPAAVSTPPVAVPGARHANQVPSSMGLPASAPRDALLGHQGMLSLGSGRPRGCPRKSSFSLSCSEVGFHFWQPREHCSRDMQSELSKRSQTKGQLVTPHSQRPPANQPQTQRSPRLLCRL